MSSYFTKFKTLWDEFVNNQPFTVCNCACVCGSKSSQLLAQHKEYVFRFLMVLNDSYGTLIGKILLIEPFPPLSKVCSLVLQEEKKRNIGNTVNVVQQLDPVAMYVNCSKSFQGNQGHASNQGHVRNNGGKGGNFKKERPVRTYCGFTGHIVDKCYKLHGYPLGYKPKVEIKLWLIKSQEVLVLMIFLMFNLVMLISSTLVFRLPLVFHSQILEVLLVVLVFGIVNRPLSLNAQFLRFNVNSFSIF